MLKAIELENFKSFGTRTRLEFAPITLLFGENSAGKSSVLQALGLLKQTRESGDNAALLTPRSESGIVDLGSFQELLFDHDPDRTLSFRLDLPAGRAPTPLFPSRLRQETGALEAFPIGVEFGFYLRPEDKEICLKNLSLCVGDDPDPAIVFAPTELSEDQRRLVPHSSLFWHPRRPIGNTEVRAAKCVAVSGNPQIWDAPYRNCRIRSDQVVSALREMRGELFGKRGSDQATLFVEDPELRAAIAEAEQFYSSDFPLVEFIERMRQAQIGKLVLFDTFLPIPAPFELPHQFPELAATQSPHFRGYSRIFFFDAPSVVAEAGRLLDELLQSLFPMGPYRRPPERLYVFTGTTPQSVGYRGQLLPDLLFRQPDLLHEANAWLDRFGIGYRIKIEPVGQRLADLFEVRLTDHRRSPHVDVGISDVGFGISQLLPFVVQSLASKRQIITIEQPEVHVHPRLQADLGDLLIAAIQEPRSHQLIIETHSEHLILRLLRRIRETTDGELPEHHPGLRPDQLSVIYLERGQSGARATQLRVNDAGEFIDRWPKGFFAERAAELF